MFVSVYHITETIPCCSRAPGCSHNLPSAADGVDPRGWAGESGSSWRGLVWSFGMLKIWMIHLSFCLYSFENRIQDFQWLLCHPARCSCFTTWSWMCRTSRASMGIPGRSSGRMNSDGLHIETVQYGASMCTWCVGNWVAIGFYWLHPDHRDARRANSSDSFFGWLQNSYQGPASGTCGTSMWKHVWCR